MDISAYLDQIIFWGGVALSALGGTSISIGAIVSWLKNTVTKSVDKLSDGKKDYDTKCERLELASKNCTEAGNAMIAVAEQLKNFSEIICKISGICNENTTNMEKISQAIALLAANTPYLVANGVSNQISELLGVNKVDLTIEEVATDETDS